MLALLCLNLAACAWHRRRQVLLAWRGAGEGEPGRGRRFDPLLSWAGHLALILAMGFSLAGSVWGFLGTRNIPVGAVLTEVYDWGAGADRPLPFQVRVLELRREPYPRAVRVGAREIRSGRKLELATTHVGEPFRLSGLPGTFRVTEFDPAGKSWEFEWSRPQWGITSFRQGEDVPGTGIELVLVGFKEFAEDRTLAAVVEVVRGEEVLPRAEVSPNRPFSIGGIDLHLTSVGTDGTGAPFVGFQVVSDPFAVPAMAMGAVFFLCAAGAAWLRLGGRR